MQNDKQILVIYKKLNDQDLRKNVITLKIIDIEKSISLADRRTAVKIP